jgi:hypothetical protein
MKLTDVDAVINERVVVRAATTSASTLETPMDMTFLERLCPQVVMKRDGCLSPWKEINGFASF